MAKLPDIKDVTSGYGLPKTINENFQQVLEAFKNTVSRDGSTPNFMAADFDMNSHDILNAGTVYADNLNLKDVDLQHAAEEAQAALEQIKEYVEILEKVALQKSITILTEEGVQTYTKDYLGKPFGPISGDVFIVGGSPFGSLTKDEDFKVDGDRGEIIFNFSPGKDELYHVLYMARYSTSEAQAIIEGIIDAVKGAGLTYLNRSSAVTSLSSLDTRVNEIKWITNSGKVIGVSKKAGATAIPDMPGWVPADAITPEHFGAVGDGVADDGAKIVAALNYAHSIRAPEVLLTRNLYATTTSIAWPVGSQNLVLRGFGPAPLSTSFSATRINYTGVADDDLAVLDIRGRSTGSAARGIFVDCKFLAGEAIRLSSVFRSSFTDLYAIDYRKIGFNLTISAEASSDAWYTSKNSFERCSATSTYEGTRAWALVGVSNGIRRNGAWGNTFVNCDGHAARTLNPSRVPGGLYLGYCDSNQFIKCDFGLFSSPELPEDQFSSSLNTLVNRNGASLTDGHVWRVRDGRTSVSNPATGPRWGALFLFDKTSDLTPDGVNILAPLDNVGRWLRYFGAGVLIDGDVEQGFPHENVFTNCALARYEPIADITSIGNVPGRSSGPYRTSSCVFWPYPVLDYQDIPHHISHVSGMTTRGEAFGHSTFGVRGGPLSPLTITDSPGIRRFRIFQNSGTGTENFGLTIACDERPGDSDEWAEVRRVNITRTGDLTPGSNAVQDIGKSTSRFREVYAQRVFLGGSSVLIREGLGTPEGVVTAPVGSMYLRTDGGTGTTLYVKESGTGNTGWAAR